MTLAAALAGIGLLALVIAFIWWLVSWGRKDDAALRAQDGRIDELRRSIDARDQAITALQDDAVRSKAALAAAEKQRATAIALVEKIGKDNPGAVAGAIRDQLDRLRALQAVVPGVPATASGEGDHGDDAVHDRAGLPGE